MTSAKLIDGSALAGTLRAQLKQEIEELIRLGHRRPCLAVVLVGEDPASQIYVAHKEKGCAAVGIASRTYRLGQSTSPEELNDLIHNLNADDEVDGILLQLPIPKHLSREQAVVAIDPAKDVDGLTPTNQGKLVWKQDSLYPCTPLGIMKLIQSVSPNISGKVAAVLGRSVLVGSPVASLLCHAGATVIGLHSESRDPRQWSRQADILVAATGVHHLVRGDWIRPGAIVIDVGIHRRDNKISGDVCFAEAVTTAGAITPVPGGVGPMTIAMLLSNCVKAYRLRTRILAVP